jgi:crotonobetainyl-CoA:carnitine CoA-transferase CaiB-like acyl-CoA transferase
MTVDRTTAGGPLGGVRVLEVTSCIAGQTAGMLLADLGADVLRVATVGAPAIGSPDHPGWLCRNRGKRLARSGSVEEFRRHGSRLVGRADILLTDLGPGELGLWGLTSDDVSTLSPGCVHAWMPALTAGGVYRDLPHDELLLEALSGMAAYHPAHEERPVASVVPLLECLHGILGAVHATIELVGRERTGRVRPVNVGGLRAAALAMHLLQIQGVGGPIVYSGNKSVDGNAHYRLYQAADGEWVFLAALGDVLFIEALTVLDRLDVLARPDVAGDFGNLLRSEVSREVGQELEKTFATRTAADWVDRFAAADVPVARLGDPAAWLTSDAVAHACPPLRYDHLAVGPLLMPGVPIGLSAAPAPAPPPPTPRSVLDLTELVESWEGAPGRRTPRAGPSGDRRDRPLAGCRVIELATFVAAPVIGSLLSGAGADVIKVEPPSGDPYRSYLAAFASLNHGKRLTTIDVRDADGRDELMRLASSGDVLIDNLRPASLERLGLTADVVERAAPGLVRASVTAFGQTGPWVNGPGFDPIVQAMSGLAAVQGGEDRPVATSSPAHDMATGSLGALGVAAALFERERGGRAQRVWVSLTATSTVLQTGELTSYPGRARPPTGGRDHPGPSPCHRYYRASDGWIAVRATDEPARRAFAEAVGLTGHQLDDRALTDRCAAAIRSRAVGDWLERLADLGVPACRVVERGEFDDPLLMQAGYFELIDTDGSVACASPLPSRIDAHPHRTIPVDSLWLESVYRSS